MQHRCATPGCKYPMHRLGGRRLPISSAMSWQRRIGAQPTADYGRWSVHCYGHDVFLHLQFRVVARGAEIPRIDVKIVKRDEPAHSAEVDPHATFRLRNPYLGFECSKANSQFTLECLRGAFRRQMPGSAWRWG